MWDDPNDINTEDCTHLTRGQDGRCYKCGHCEHVWGPEGIRPEGGNTNDGLAFTGTGSPETRLPGLKDRVIERNTASQGQFCQHCQAWRGSLGLEPTPELFISHIVQVFREVKRVLHKSGTVWLNLGSSMWGGKGKSGQAWATDHQDKNTLQKSQHQITGMGETG